MDSVIHSDGLTKKYGDFAALDHLDLDVQKGEILGYLGPNGAGKTTTIRLLLGLIKPTSGQALIFGLDSQKDKIAVHKRLAYVPGEASLWPNLTGEETFYLLGKIHGQMDMKYLKKLIELFRFDPKKKVRTYSKGNRQKINLIVALASRADLLILDEPTAGLDPIMEEAFKDCVLEAKANGQTVFLSSHVLSEVEALCDRVAILRSGKLVELGTLQEMRHLSAVTVIATFDAKPPKISHIENVKNIHASGHQLTCQVHGDISPLITVLAAAKPKTLLSREPSLEELFLSLYGEDKAKKGA